MTITKQRIEAEIEAEVKRIKAWNQTTGHYRLSSLYKEDIISLANHLVRNQLQVEMAQDAALLEAAKEAMKEAIVMLEGPMPSQATFDVRRFNSTMAALRDTIAQAEGKETL